SRRRRPRWPAECARRRLTMTTTAAPAIASLRTLRDKPFELLQEIEKLARAALVGQGRDAGGEREWVGVAFRLSSESFLTAREETREVLGFPPVLTRVPGAKP